MYKVLLVDDNTDIQQANRDYLTEKGYRVDTAFSGTEALSKLKETTYDCVLLDILLPDLDGYAICTVARKTIKTPIIFLSCMDSEDNRVRGLMYGGDDYICKPYSLSELGARVYAQIRRNRMDNSEDTEPYTNILYDKEQRTVTINGTNIILSKLEYDLLTLLISEPDRVFGAEELLSRVWGPDTTADNAAVRVYIQRIRTKMGTDRGVGCIMNDYGSGYRYAPPHGVRP